VSAFVLVTVLGIIAEVIGLVAEIVITEVITEVVVLVVLRSLLGGGLLRGLLVGLDLGLGAALALRLGLLLDILVVRLGSRLRGDIGDGAALHESGGQLVHSGGQFFDLLFQRHQGFSRSLRRMVGGSSALAFSGRVGSTGGCMRGQRLRTIHAEPGTVNTPVPLPSYRAAVHALHPQAAFRMDAQ